MLAGCRFSSAGLAKKLDFQAVVDDQIAGAWPVLAIGPGTELSIRVLEHDTLEPLPITEWMVDEPSVLAAERGESNTLRLLGLTPGSSLVRVRSGVIEDAIRIDVVPVVAAEVFGPLGTSQKDERSLVALAGEQGELPIFHFGPNREGVFALGTTPTVGLEPAGLARILPPEARSGARLHLVFEAPGYLAIAGGSGPTLNVDVVLPERVDGLFVEPAKGASGERSLAAYRVRVVSGGRSSLLVSSGFTVEITTPEVCARATGDAELETRRFHGRGAFSVQAIAPGKCEGVVRLGEQHDLFSVELSPPVSPPDPSAPPAESGARDGK